MRAGTKEVEVHESAAAIGDPGEENEGHFDVQGANRGKASNSVKLAIFRVPVREPDRGVPTWGELPLGGLQTELCLAEIHAGEEQLPDAHHP